jgi:hypothetical protein
MRGRVSFRVGFRFVHPRFPGKSFRVVRVTELGDAVAVDQSGCRLVVEEHDWAVIRPI